MGPICGELSAQDWVVDRELADHLQRLLDQPDEVLIDELAGLYEEYREGAYVELLHALTHRAFSGKEAREHWDQITSLHRDARHQLGRSLDLRVSTLDYFTDRAPLLDRPAIIERSLLERAKQAAFHDALTGLRNYRFFCDALPQELGRARQEGTPLSLLVIDVDGFKEYNDLRGHEEGNRALNRLAGLLREGVRAVDIPVRYGGDEFAVILPATPKLGGLEVANRLADRTNGALDGLTISIGVATHPADADTADGLVRRADAALYDAKKEDAADSVRVAGGDVRSYPRFSVRLDALWHLEDQQLPATVLDIGEGGALIRLPRRLSVDSVVDLSVALPQNDRSIRTLLRVVRVDAGDGGESGYETATRTIEMRAQHRWALRNYVERLQVP